MFLFVRFFKEIDCQNLNQLLFMKKQKLSLKNLEVKSFKTGDVLRGGTLVSGGLLSDPLGCTVWCKTGPTCPECAYTLPGQGPACEFPEFTDGC